MAIISEFYIKFYKDKAGRDKITGFLDSINEKSRMKVIRGIKLLKMDPWLPYPHTSHIRKECFRELRVLFGGNYYRCFYRVYKKEVFIAHVIVKKKLKIDKNDIEIAHKRFKEYEKRTKVR